WPRCSASGPTAAGCSGRCRCASPPWARSPGAVRGAPPPASACRRGRFRAPSADRAAAVLVGGLLRGRPGQEQAEDRGLRLEHLQPPAVRLGEVTGDREADAGGVVAADRPLEDPGTQLAG